MIVDYLRSGVQAGMTLPDAADAKVETFLVTALPWPMCSPTAEGCCRMPGSAWRRPSGDR